MLKLRNTKFMAALAGAVLSLSIATPSNANIQEKMDQIFGDMSNYTQPGAFNTQRRGVLNGGSLISRSQIVDTTLLNIDLPHASGGCGGMDMFAGSISFINADQFIALLRAIAANAKGYAFQIAMNAASSLIASKLGEFQKTIQALNSLSMNSCELAKGVVNMTFDAVGASEVRKTHGTEANLSGITDVAGSFWHSDSVKNPTMTVSKKAESDPALAKKLDSAIGNLVWKELKRNGAKSALGTSEAVDEYGALMAITGSYIIEKPVEDQSNAQESDFPSRPLASLIDPKDFIEGGTLKIYSCADDETNCLNPTIKKTKVTGFKKKIYDALVGNFSTTGIISKYRYSLAFTEDEAKIAGGMPEFAGTIIANLSKMSPTTARAFADDIATAVAMHYAFDLAQQYLHMAIYAISTSKMVSKDKLLNTLEARELYIHNAKLAYAKDHKSLPQILTEYNTIMKNMETVALVANTTMVKNSGNTNGKD